MDNQPKSMVMPIAITVLITAVIFGVGGYYLASGQIGADDTDTAAGVLTTPSPKATTTTTVSSGTVDTSTWKTYSLAKYKFSIKHPADWKLTDKTQSVGAQAGPNDSLVLTAPTLAPGITLYVNVAGHGMAAPEEEYTLAYKDGKMTIALKATYTPAPGDELPPQKGVLNFAGDINGNNYVIQVSGADETSEKELVKAIISSYKAL